MDDFSYFRSMYEQGASFLQREHKPNIATETRTSLSLQGQQSSKFELSKLNVVSHRILAAKNIYKS